MFLYKLQITFVFILQPSPVVNIVLTPPTKLNTLSGFFLMYLINVYRCVYVCRHPNKTLFNFLTAKKIIEKMLSLSLILYLIITSTLLFFSLMTSIKYKYLQLIDESKKKKTEKIVSFVVVLHLLCFGLLFL